MNRVKAFVQKIWTYDLVHTAVYSIVLELIVECFNRRGIMGLAFPFMHPIIFIYNTLIIMTSMALALFFRRRMFVYSVVSVFWIGLALTNFIILSSRKTPFTAMDFYLIKDAIKVAGLYVSVIQIILIALLVIAVIAGLVFLWRKAPKLEVTIKKTKFVAYAAVQMILVFLAAYGMGITLLFTGAVEGHFGNLAQAYKKYGFSHCFVSSVLDRGIKKSGDYSEEYMDSLKNDLDNVDVEASEKTPNIIFVQLESFFDPTHVKGITLSENPLPNYQKLISECSSGYLSVPCFGAGTCNTELVIQLMQYTIMMEHSMIEIWCFHIWDMKHLLQLNIWMGLKKRLWDGLRIIFLQERLLRHLIQQLELTMCLQYLYRDMVIIHLHQWKDTHQRLK